MVKPVKGKGGAAAAAPVEEPKKVKLTKAQQRALEAQQKAELDQHSKADKAASLKGRAVHKREHESSSDEVESSSSEESGSEEEVHKSKKKATGSSQLDEEYQTYIEDLVNEVFETLVNGWTPHVVSIPMLLNAKHEEMKAYQGKFTSIQVASFVNQKPELKEKAIKTAESIKSVSWTIIETFAKGIYDPKVEPKIVNGVAKLKAAKVKEAKNWNADTIINCSKEGRIRDLIRHVLPEVKLA